MAVGRIQGRNLGRKAINVVSVSQNDEAFVRS